jgi:integrase
MGSTRSSEPHGGAPGLERATCHQLRHTCLTRLREAGMALEAVQAQAGHVSIESTRIYLHLSDDWLAGEYRRAAALIDADTAELLAVQEINQ